MPGPVWCCSVSLCLALSCPIPTAQPWPALHEPARSRPTLPILSWTTQPGSTPGAHPRGPSPPPPWDLKKHYIFRVSSVKLRDLHLLSLFFKFLLCGKTEEACSMVNSLRKVDFSHPTGHYTWKFFSGPLEKILGAPLHYPIPPGPALPYTALPLLSGSADHLRSFPAPSGNDRPFMTHPGPPVLFGAVKHCSALPDPAWTCLALSGPVLPFPSLPGSVRRCLALSGPARPV